MLKPYAPVIFFILFCLFGLFAHHKAFAADPNDFRKPNQWQRERTINDSVNKSSVKVEASKTYPVSTPNQYGKAIKQIRNAKATVTLGASTANVGKSLMKRTPYGAITQAVIAILGKSVDWVLDPENNRVKYKDLTNNDYKYRYCLSNGTCYYTPDSACRALVNTDPPFKYHSYTAISPPFSYLCRAGYNELKPDPYSSIVFELNPNYVDDDDWKYIPISDIAAKVINHAEDGQAPAMQVMNDAALDALEAGLLDAQLDAASNVPQPDPQEITQAQYDNPDYPENGTGTGTGPETPVDPETPTDPVDPNPNPNPDANPFQLPPFCSWASKVCDFIDWVQTEPPEPPESGEVDVQIPDSNMHEGILERLYINMPAQCPPDPILEFMGAKIPFPMSIFCQFAEMMKPLILLFAYIKGLSIIGNGLT